MKILPSENLHKEMERKLSKNHLCYVLITCDEGGEEGAMNVEMSYGGGDPVLASYLLHGAKAFIDEEIEQELE